MIKLILFYMFLFAMGIVVGVSLVKESNEPYRPEFEYCTKMEDECWVVGDEEE